MPDFHKDDSGKPRPELIPPDALLLVAEVLAIGAKKYGDTNWAAGAAWSRYYGAAQRHLLAWWNGEDDDPETGCSHLTHAICSLLFLLAYEAREIGVDDRISTGPTLAGGVTGGSSESSAASFPKSNAIGSPS